MPNVKRGHVEQGKGQHRTGQIAADTARRSASAGIPQSASSHDHESARRKRHAGELCRVSIKVCRNSGSSKVLPSSAKPSMNINRIHTAKVRSLNKMEINDGIFAPPLQRMTNRSEAAATMERNQDEVGFEPVVPLPLVEHDLQAAQAQGDKSRDPRSQSCFTQFAAAQVCGILDQARGEQQRQDADRKC